MEIGKYIAIKRNELGLTQRELAERSEISVSALARIEFNRTKPSLKTLLKLEKALNLEFGTLLDYTGD